MMWIQQFLPYLSLAFDPGSLLFAVCLPSCKDELVTMKILQKLQAVKTILQSFEGQYRLVHLSRHTKHSFQYVSI